MSSSVGPSVGSSAEPLRIGIVGLGAISRVYLTGLADPAASSRPDARGLQVVALADLDRTRAEAALPLAPDARVLTPDELMAADDVDLVLNLTIPGVHAEVSGAALAAGKHVYSEKPFALDPASGADLLKAAGSELLVGCAPDTVLGTPVQSARRAVAEGTIGVPVAATAMMAVPGHERWHPDPEFYYAPGGGPLFDMGPYYLSALVHILGPVRRVIGAASRARTQRTIGSGPRVGTVFGVDVDTHVTGTLEHVGGALTTVVMSFDVIATDLPNLEIHGTEASLAGIDPNTFDHELRIRARGDEEWRPVLPSAGYAGAARGIGVADLADRCLLGLPPRASGQLGLHVLTVMDALLDAARGTGYRDIVVDIELPEIVPLTGLA